MKKFLLLFLIAAGPAWADECIDNIPTDAQIPKLVTPILYQWWQLSRRMADQVATATVTGKPVDPCAKALAWKRLDFERELKFR
ncbi:hypothetical protein [Bradyrhizobium sp. Ai1a-2]|uniref:hypothetical protein n=1 Tax=Bradyrhizobium sp. Ai1a-2 TaxID=196490 RepID=UPI0003F9CE98|nr:hypothetical protein [Bradyrhizobium sp. Ai1a-2]